MPDSQRKPRIGLFATCLVDMFRPGVGFATAALLELSGCDVTVPTQTCCGQPAFNSGDRKTAKALALQVMDAFAECDYVVAPSGSCAGMLACHYPSLFADDPDLAPAARAFAEKCWEVTSFLVNARGVASIKAEFPRRIVYHDACSGLRELRIRNEPRQLLSGVRGLEILDMRDAEACCGFGGAFAVKYGDISGAIVDKKAARIEETKAQALLGGDLGCLINIAGRLSRRGRLIEVRHVAEVLSGMTDGPAIGAGKPSPIR